MRPSAPPLLFWKVRASTTCSRVTLPILVRTRPIGRPLSSLIGGMAPGTLGTAPPPLTPPAGPAGGRAAPGVAAAAAPFGPTAPGGRAAGVPAGRTPGAAGVPAGRATPGVAGMP